MLLAGRAAEDLVGCEVTKKRQRESGAHVGHTSAFTDKNVLAVFSSAATDDVTVRMVVGILVALGADDSFR